MALASFQDQSSSNLLDAFKRDDNVALANKLVGVGGGGGGGGVMQILQGWSLKFVHNDSHTC